MKAVSLYGSDENIRRAFDETHKKLECCGGKNYTDWFFVPWTDDISVSKQINLAIPESCCDRSNASAQHIKCTTTVPRKHLNRMTPYLHGCAETMAYLYRYSLIGCLHDRANIEQLARRSMVYSMPIKTVGEL